MNRWSVFLKRVISGCRNDADTFLVSNHLRPIRCFPLFVEGQLFYRDEIHPIDFMDLYRDKFIAL